MRTLVLTSLLLRASVFSFGQASSDPRTVHVFVALCDNANQGIVPVPKVLGNGQDPMHNLYWGAAFGLKTFFGKSSAWERITPQQEKTPPVLERILFKHRTTGTLLLADAYDGAHMRTCVTDHLNALAGRDTVHVPGSPKDVYFGGGADLVVFIGHDGLMDFDLQPDDIRSPVVGRTADAMVLCCYSERYFGPQVAHANGKLLLGTRGLMAPEAYVLHAALESWITNEDVDHIRQAAAAAYNTYQKCGLKGARNLFGAKAVP